MKKTVFLFLSIGLLGGFAIGHASKSTPAAEPAPQPPTPTVEPQQTAKPESARPTHSKEQALLLQAINELDLTTTELEDTLAYIQKLERNTKRYNWLMNHLKEKEFGTSYQMNFSSYNKLKPPDDIAEFFDGDDAQTDHSPRPAWDPMLR